MLTLRRDEPALRHGGLRWVHADADTLVFLREAPTSTVLVLARRAAGTPVRLPGVGAADNVYGNAPALRPDADGAVTLPAEGPTFQVWRLPLTPSASILRLRPVWRGFLPRLPGR